MKPLLTSLKRLGRPLQTGVYVVGLYGAMSSVSAHLREHPWDIGGVLPYAIAFGMASAYFGIVMRSLWVVDKGS